MKSLVSAAVIGAAAFSAMPVHAQDLRIGLSSEASSADPHFHNLGPNNQLARHVFGGLVESDSNGKVGPALAVSWKALNPTTWEFKLRPNVKFSNGKPFTARDVIYSFCRLGKVEGSPSSFVFAVRNIETVDTPDPLTLVIKTDSPVPLLPNNMNSVQILSAETVGGKPDLAYKKGDCGDIGARPKSVEFNNPAFAIGAGPYKIVEFTRGSQVVLQRNESYWGAQQPWQRVIFKPLTNAGARVAALLAGDVDLIETPPIQDFDRIKNANFNIVQGLSNRIIYVHLDQHNDAAWKTPGIRGTDKNPLLDKRVREALSIAINRKGIVERIMGGVAVPAGELLPFPLFGTTKDFPVPPFDADRAKKLLTEAGYPNGFEITLGTPNDRYINDEKVAQAIAQMWARIGVKTNIDAMTASTFFARRNKFEFSAYLAGWGADTNELSNSLNALILTHDPKRGIGGTNRGRYSNKAVDDLVIKAMATIDNGEREKLLQQASKISMADIGLIPLHFEVTPWAFKKGISYAARVDQSTLAMEAKPAK
jgi:peptide/nickel transport system substrate-binding protein